jgi:hypothetical protein
MRKLNPDPGNPNLSGENENMRFNVLNRWQFSLDSWRLTKKNPDPYSMNPDPQRFQRQAGIRLGDNQCFGSWMFIPDLDFLHPGSRVRKVPEPGFESPTMN